MTDLFIHGAIEKETEKAVLIHGVWWPKSQINVVDDGIEVPAWLFEKRFEKCEVTSEGRSPFVPSCDDDFKNNTQKQDVESVTANKTTTTGKKCPLLVEIEKTRSDKVGTSVIDGWVVLDEHECQLYCYDVGRGMIVKWDFCDLGWHDTDFDASNYKSPIRKVDVWCVKVRPENQTYDPYGNSDVMPRYYVD